MTDQVIYDKSERFIVVLGRQGGLDRFFVRMKPITMREAVGGVVAYHWRPFITFGKSTFQLDHKLEDLPMLYFKSYPQGIVLIQIAVKLNETHIIILQG